MSAQSQEFCVRWNSHLGSIGAAFPQLLAGQRFVDVTLVCEGHQLHCHRLVLAACSSYFESILAENPCKHPVIILSRDIKLWEIQALIDFMYKGEVNVTQAGLPNLLKCAESLQIRGLFGSDAALNLNQLQHMSKSTNQNATVDDEHSISSDSTAEDAITASANTLINKTTSDKNIAIKSSQLSVTSVNPIKSFPSDIAAPQDTDKNMLPMEYVNDSANDSNCDQFKLETDMGIDDDNDGLHDDLDGSIDNDDNALQMSLDSSNSSLKRVRRSEALLAQAAKYVSKGQTFQTVSNMFNIPVSTIRFFMARKGILPKRKRGRGSSSVGSFSRSVMSNPISEMKGSLSPSEPPYQYVGYKFPAQKPDLM